MAELVFVRRGEEVMFYHLDGKSTRIGRGGDNDIAFPEHEPNVSRHHIAIEERLGMYWLRDLTGQGCLLNQETVRESSLSDEDSFSVGRWTVVFRSQTRGAGKTIVTQGGNTTPLLDPNLATVGPVATLTYQQGQMTRTVELGEAPFHIGSSPQNDLSLELSYISSFHCRIFYKKGVFFIRDLESLNHTWINGVKVVESEIPDGAEIYLGKFKLQFAYAEVESPSEETVWPGFAGIVSEDPSMERVFRLIERMAKTDASVLVTGESGTGKELVAQALHTESSRAEAPFVARNCGAISKELIESELFGHERGAFTGAVQMRVGAFEEAGHGTLFLDEIGDMPLAQQVTLLRVLEGGTFRRVGGVAPLQSHARVVTATNRDLLQLAKEGGFREDLFYRIGVLQIDLPPLRERKGDILLLAEYFLAQFAGPRDLHLAPEAEQRLLSYHWPGNVRELRNAMQNAIVMAEGQRIEADDLLLREAMSAPSTPMQETAAPAAEGGSLDQTEKQAILNALEAAHGVVSEAARMLGIGRSSMYSKMKRLGIEHRNKSS